MAKTFNVIIKRGFLNLETPREELISVVETPDGLSFKFKGGTTIVIDDPNMPSEVKQRVCVSDTSFTKGSITFDLNNYASPVSLSL